MRKLFMAMLGAIAAVFVARRVRSGGELKVGKFDVTRYVPDKLKGEPTSPAWSARTSSELNATELPPTRAARTQHEQPMHNSEESVDPAHTAHR